MKWWLISGEDVQVIRAALNAPTHRANDFNCEDWPIGDGCAGCRGDKERDEAVHTLDTGLHTTDAVPGDYQYMEVCHAGPYGDHLPYWEIEKNILRADEVARDLLAMGHEPYCPHTMSRHWQLDPRLNREDYKRLDDRIMSHCDALYFIAPSPGAMAELWMAKEMGLPIYYRLEDVPCAD